MIFILDSLIWQECNETSSILKTARQTNKTSVYTMKNIDIIKRGGTMSKKKVIALSNEQKEKFVTAMAKYIIRRKKENERLDKLRKL